MSFIGDSSISNEQKQLKMYITQAYDLIESHFDIYDSAFLTLEQCFFVTDFIFSIYEVDELIQQKIIRQIKQSDSSRRTIFQWEKEDLKNYLARVCYGCFKRTYKISMDDVVQYIDIKLIKKIENDWAKLSEKNKIFISKAEAVDLVKQELRSYKMNYAEVIELVQMQLEQIYKFVFFEDFIQIIIQISKRFTLEKKSKTNKQKCGCVIF